MRFLYAGFVIVLLAVGACGGEKQGTSSPDAMPPSADAGTTAGAFMSECMDNTDCESNLCFHYNAKGPHCTHECTRDEDCEAPSPGCNNMGVCKVP